MESKRKTRKVEMGGGIKKMKTWEEMTKLNKRNKWMIVFYVLMAIFEIGVAIFEKEVIWIIVSLLWIDIAVMEYCNTKMLKGKEAIINIQDEHIKTQDNMINNLLKYINRKTKIIKVSDIKIPKDFRKPNPGKMKNRIGYYNTYKQFAVPIIVDKDNNLIDGYTSYLIAKKYNFNNIQVQVK